MDAIALVEEATKKSGMLWLDLPDTECPRGAWHVWHEGAAYVVTGGIEQPLPGLAYATRVTVIVRSKDKGGRLVSWVAAVGQVKAGTAEWEAVVPLLAKSRLNAPDGAAQVERWAKEAYVVRLRPTGETPEAPGSMPQDYAAVRPVDSPATTAGKPPFMVRGRRRRADR